MMLINNCDHDVDSQGFYHCQLATHPPQLVWTYLDIVKPKFRKALSLSFIRSCRFITISQTKGENGLDFYSLCHVSEDTTHCNVSLKYSNVLSFFEFSSQEFS